jgi:hypothetical protein
VQESKWLVVYIVYGRKKEEAFMLFKEKPGMEFVPRKNYTICPEKTTLTVPAQTPLSYQSK